MVSTSITSGTFASSSRSELSSAAAICGKAAFFAPRTCTEPSMRLPPRTTNRSILVLSVQNGQMGAPQSTHHRRLSLLYYERHGHDRALRCPVYSAFVNLDWVCCTTGPVQRGKI